MDPQKNIRDIAKIRNWGVGGRVGGRTGTDPSELERQNQNLDQKQNGPSELERQNQNIDQKQNGPSAEHQRYS